MEIEVIENEPNVGKPKIKLEPRRPKKTRKPYVKRSKMSDDDVRKACSICCNGDIPDPMLHISQNHFGMSQFSLGSGSYGRWGRQISVQSTVISTEIALARKEITDLNITQYAVPEKVKGKIRYTARCVGGSRFHVAHAFSILFKLTMKWKSFVRFQAVWQHLEHQKQKNIKYIEHIMTKSNSSRTIIR